jgi:DNA-binding response OmpR family regulator
MKQHNPTLLIVEDDEFQQNLLKIWLEAEDYTIISAINGEQALSRVAEHKPDLVLLDLVMPGISGLQVAKQLKNDPETRQIPVVVVTVIDEQDKRIEALEMGVDDFLHKPVDRIELLVRVKNLLQSRAYFKQLQNRQAHLLQLESLASIGTLINSVTREIAKPLQALQEAIVHTQQERADDPSLLELLAKAVEHVERIDLITHNTQLYIKSVNGLSSSETADIVVILGQVLELLSDKMAEAGIQVQTDIPTDLPLVRCSAEGLMHVLVHLLLNAYEALQETLEPCIKIGMMRLDAEHLMLTVCDNNKDFAENLRSLITDPLFSAKLPEVCTGLGLALACHFIEQSGGTISIDSALGRGCCMKAVLKTT